MSATEIVLRFGSSGGTLNLYPTENRLSDGALSMLASDVVSRYPGSEGPGYFYGDPCGIADLYEQCAILARRYFSAAHAFVQFLSGLHAMQSMISTLTVPGEPVTVLGPGAGGHYATEQICRDFGHEPAVMPFDRRELRIDLDALAARARRGGCRFYYLDLSIALRLPDMTAFREAVGPGAIICFDASHVLGLLPAVYDLGRLWSDVNLCTASTHKTFPGPQKAIMLSGDDDVAAAMRDHLAFRVSSAHTNSIGALAVTLAELESSKRAYGRAVIRNARALGASLAARGLPVVGEHFGFTETHQLWLLPAEPVDAIEWGRRLQAAGMRATAVGLPPDGRPGIRIGTQELTRTGVEPGDMEKLADLVARALGGDDPSGTLRAEVLDFASSFSTVRTEFS